MRMPRLVSTLILLLVSTATPADPPPRFDLQPRQVSPRVWYFEGEAGMAARENRGFMSNAGFVVTSEGVVVFDALATPPLAEAMVRAIGKVTAARIQRVIVSHYHADHVYGLQVFRALGAQIWAREQGQAYLASDLARERLAQRRRDLSPWVDESTRLVGADRWIRLPPDGMERFEFGDTRFELVSGGNSHAPGDLMLHVPSEHVLFAGDLFFTGRLPFVVDGNTRDWLESLARIESANAHVVIPGHGRASVDVSHDLQTTRGYLEFLRTTMGRAVDDLIPFDEAYASADWSSFRALPAFDQANRRNAYSVYLEMQAEALAPRRP